MTATKSPRSASRKLKKTKKCGDGDGKGFENKSESIVIESDIAQDTEDTDEDSDVSTETRSNAKGKVPRKEDGPQTSKWQQVGKKGKSAKQGKYICKGGDTTCNKAIKSNEACIQCDACANWFHPACQGLCTAAFDAITEFDLFWVCTECRESFTEKQNIQRQVKQEIEKAEARVINKMDEVKSLVEKAIDKKVDDGLKKVELKIGESSSALKKVVQAKNIDRTKNLILYNIPECDSTDPKVRQEKDQEAIRKMTTALCGSENDFGTVHTFRLNKRQSNDQNEVDRRSRLLLVKFEREEDVETLLKERFRLRDVGFPNVYVNRDLPKEERERQWKLRQELKKKGRDTHRIFRGQVVPKDQ